MGEPNESAAARNKRRAEDAKPPKQAPTVGRVVHFYSNPQQPAPFAATVAAVCVVGAHEARINIGYLSALGSAQCAQGVTYSETPTPAPRWCWPPRV